jgi:HPt (histidine-containing phosphotransfer) domain-containing protein
MKPDEQRLQQQLKSMKLRFIRDHYLTLVEQAAREQWPPLELLARLMHDRTLEASVIAAFLEDVPKQLAALEHLLAVGDRPGLERQAHQLKGTAANFGAGELRLAVLALEQDALEGDNESLRPLLYEVKRAFRALADVIRRQMPTAGGPGTAP